MQSIFIPSFHSTEELQVVNYSSLFCQSQYGLVIKVIFLYFGIPGKVKNSFFLSHKTYLFGCRSNIFSDYTIRFYLVSHRFSSLLPGLIQSLPNLNFLVKSYNHSQLWKSGLIDNKSSLNLSKTIQNSSVLIILAFNFII